MWKAQMNGGQTKERRKVQRKGGKYTGKEESTKERMKEQRKGGK